MDSSQMHATLGLHVNKLDVKTISAIHHPPTQRLGTRLLSLADTALASDTRSTISQHSAGSCL